MKLSKKVTLLDFKLRKAIGNTLYGLYRSKFSGSWIDFSEHREYQTGNSIKNIDWKSSAKSEKMYEKIYEEDRDLEVLIIADISKSFSLALRERTKKDIVEELVYSLFMSAYQNGDSIWFYFWEEYFDYSKEFWNLLSFFEYLESQEYEESSRLEKILEKLQKKHIKNKLIFVLTDSFDFWDDRIFSGLAKENEIVYMQVFDFYENTLDSSFSSLSLGTSQSFFNVFLWKKKQQEFSEFRNQKIQNFEKELKKKDISYLYFDTKTDIFTKLLLFYRK